MDKKTKKDVPATIEAARDVLNDVRSCLQALEIPASYEILIQDTGPVVSVGVSTAFYKRALLAIPFTVGPVGVSIHKLAVPVSKKSRRKNP